ncbi:tetratricopeptide repeat (TPR)-like superfamily protein [Actinidia rufa]|uniref:Tetratricopeptide repeat (TPR)-like superfamily protein n=1 Tax=Actinidia rufa TaxID=165716 RepID=A0A7J0GFG8_9ERIC|nr:tetratricopeptide repeat (TPR)-like superfamily protein [Actinidia rufa]
MGLDGVEPDGFTMVSLLTACAELGALALGRRTHVYMVFDEMGERSVVSWNCLVVGLAVNGFGNEALEVFKDLERERLVPTGISFIGVLYARSHCGMVDEGFAYFKRMTEEFGIVPRIEHYGCMVDLLGRAGLFLRKSNVAFCHSTEDCEASGDMVHHLNGKPVSVDYNGGSKVIHAPRNCTEWMSKDNALNLV